MGAEEVGFDFSVTSDHFFPSLDELGHSPHAWTVLGAAAQATSRIPLMTYVTCPSFRYHPAVVAQKAATLQNLSDGRFTLELGSGENLGWKVNAELPGPSAFDAASQFVGEEDVGSSIPCGDDVDAVIEAAKEDADAGFTHLALLRIGGDQQTPYLEWTQKTLLPAWRAAFGS